MSYTGLSLGESYPTAAKQSVYLQLQPTRQEDGYSILFGLMAYQPLMVI